MIKLGSANPYSVEALLRLLNALPTNGFGLHTSGTLLSNIGSLYCKLYFQKLPEPQKTNQQYIKRE